MYGELESAPDTHVVIDALSGDFDITTDYISVEDESRVPGDILENFINSDVPILLVYRKLKIIKSTPLFIEYVTDAYARDAMVYFHYAMVDITADYELEGSTLGLMITELPNSLACVYISIVSSAALADYTSYETSILNNIFRTAIANGDIVAYRPDFIIAEPEYENLDTRQYQGMKYNITLKRHLDTPDTEFKKILSGLILISILIFTLVIMGAMSVLRRKKISP